MPRRPQFLAGLLALAVAATAVGVTVFLHVKPAAAAGEATANQVLTVQTASPTATTAKIDLWQRNSIGQFVHIWGSAPGFVGELGVGRTADNIARTPAGVFTLTQAFGNQPNRGTRLPYFLAGPSDWWNGEDNSPAYNTHVRQAASPGPNSENLYRAGVVYSRAVVINYNTSPVVKGAGSAFFLHVSNGQPTAGCVSMPANLLDQVMYLLDPKQHPVISIGVGAAATTLITRTNNGVATKRNPFGSLDSVTPTGGRVARVVGWAADPDNLNARLTVKIYIDNLGYGAYATGVPRPDVVRTRHTGPNPGYSQLITLKPGAHQVCTYAVNIGIGNANSRLGCKYITVR
ncbi:L,D-transpeptidase family protein [Jatrophihabitans sp. DSM 45814]